MQHSWNEHISLITAKANGTLGFVKRDVKTNNSKVKELAYKTLVRPQVEYASPNIKKIEMIQRRAARWVTGNFSSYDSVSNMLCELGWRSLADRRIDARMIYKIINGYVAIQLPSYFDRPGHEIHSPHAPSCFQTDTQWRKVLSELFLPCIDCSLEQTSF